MVVVSNTICGKPAAPFIPRWGSWFACMLPPGHEGSCQPGGNCVAHGPYLTPLGVPPCCPHPLTECLKIILAWDAELLEWERRERKALAPVIYLHEPMASPGATPAAGAQAQRVFRPGRLFSHLMADTEEELRGYATSIGLPLQWIQYPGTPRVHFDITGRWFERIKRDPRVRYVTLREWAVWLTSRRVKVVDNGQKAE